MLIKIDYSELEDILVAQAAQLAEQDAMITQLAARLAILEPPGPHLPEGVPAGIRGLWIQRTNDHAKARARVQAAASVGANTIFVFTGTGRGVTFVNSQGIPSSDSLTATIDEAKQHNISVYPCLPSKYFWRAEYPDQNLRTFGISENWLDFTNADARGLIAHLAYDMTQYDIAGVILDYTRFSRHWYADAGFTSASITVTIQTVHEVLQSTGKKLTASPISVYDKSKYSALNYGQKWHDWIEHGLVDFLIPMVYSGQGHLDRRLSEWTQAGYYPQMVAPIIAPSKWSGGSTETPKTDNEWRTEIRTVLDGGARGVVVFDERTLSRHPSKAQILLEEWQP